MKRQTWAIAILAALTASQAFAVDIITRKSDSKKASGAITEMSQTEIKLKKAVGEPEVVAANDVAAIQWDAGGPELPLGYSDENNGKYDSAIKRYTKARDDAKNPSDYLKAEFEYVIARANGLASLADPDKQKAAIAMLEKAQKGKPEHFRYYESVHVLGQIQVASGDFAAARTTFEQLAKAPWNEYKMLAKISSGRVNVAEKKLDAATADFEAAAAMATDAAPDQARKYEAMLGQAQAQIAQSKFEDALKILELVTDKGPADESALQAEAYVLQGNALQSLGRLKEATIAYLHVDLLYPREAASHAEALYNLTKSWKQVQYPDRSALAAGKLEKQYPNSIWRKKLASGE
jgi:tetratricopeptide (TPR) repeat protein